MVLQRPAGHPPFDVAMPSITKDRGPHRRFCPDDQSRRKPYRADVSKERMVLQERIELSTSPLPRECSTTELRQRANGEGRLLPQGSPPCKLENDLYSAAWTFGSRGSRSAVQTSTRAAARASMWAFEWKGPGVMRSLSVPRGTVG